MNDESDGTISKYLSVSEGDEEESES